MADLSPADRAFLAQAWRWVTFSDASIKTIHSGAREAEFQSGLVTAAGAQAAVQLIAPIICIDRDLIVATVDGLIDVSARGRAPTVKLLTDRFGGDVVNGRLFLVERFDRDWTTRRTSLYLTG